MNADLVARSLQICERALSLAELGIRDIDDVILVGGMTRMPAIQRAVGGFFARAPSRGVHPDEVVALGAAIAASSLEGAANSGVVPLRDVTAHPLGIMVAGGLFDVLIPGNTTVPTRTTSVFATSRDDQDTVKIVVLQGQSEVARENTFLGQFALTRLRRAKAGEVEVEVAFEIDESGIFRVAAMDRETGLAQEIQVIAQSGISDAEIVHMMSDAKAYLADRRREEKNERARQGIDVLLAELDRMLPEAEARAARTTIAPAALIKARGIVENVRRVALEGDADELMDHAKTLAALTAQLRTALG
jgi:molecular chaperone DnaK